MLSGSSCVCVHRSELDVTVVDLLRKLEPALWEPAVLKFQSVTTWATIRNKSGFVTAEMQKLRTNWNQQQPLQKREEYTGGGAPDSTPLAASSDAPAPLALSSPSAAVHSNGRNSWAHFASLPFLALSTVLALAACSQMLPPPQSLHWLHRNFTTHTVLGMVVGSNWMDLATVPW